MSGVFCFCFLPFFFSFERCVVSRRAYDGFQNFPEQTIRAVRADDSVGFLLLGSLTKVLIYRGKTEIASSSNACGGWLRQTDWCAVCRKKIEQKIVAKSVRRRCGIRRWVVFLETVQEGRKVIDERQKRKNKENGWERNLAV